MRNIKPIRTEASYVAALARIEELMGAEYGSAAGDELDLLTDLVQVYESKALQFGSPTPVEAIKFRMEQGGLAVRDLIPFIGSRAKVSEVLAGKRDITMQMARALHEHLGIPASVLLQRSTESSEEYGEKNIPWERFPIKTLISAGWIPGGRKGDSAEKLMRPLAKYLSCTDNAWFRKGSRANAKADVYALRAWCMYVHEQATQLVLKLRIRHEYKKGTITAEFLRELAQLSRTEDGPLQVQRRLADVGVVLALVPHLPRTYLDGAAMKLKDGRPVIAVTLRYDRIDNFWFCLFHELAHIGNDLDEGTETVFDDLSLDPSDESETNADKMAQDGLIPPDQWSEFYSRGDFSPLAVVNFASTLNIHPAIVAGRVRHDERNYRLLTQFVGSGQITPLFPEFKRVA